MAEQSHTPEALKTYELAVCKWEGRVHCVYLNDYRVAGGKPWGGAPDMKTWNVTAADIFNAIPEMRRTPLEEAAAELLEALTEARAYVASSAFGGNLAQIDAAIAKATEGSV